MPLIAAHEYFHKMKYFLSSFKQKKKKIEIKNVGIFQQNKTARCSQKISLWMETCNKMYSVN